MLQSELITNAEIPTAIASQQRGRHDSQESPDWGNSLLLAIEEAAANEDRETFGLLVKKVDWSMRQPYEMIRTIDLSLSMDMAPLAMELAAMAKRIFPGDPKIEVAARVISPPQIIGTRPSQPLGIDKSKKWIKQNSSKYKGRWIAVQNGELLGDAPTLKELHHQIGQHKSTPSTIIVRVLS